MKRIINISILFLFFLFLYSCSTSGKMLEKSEPMIMCDTNDVAMIEEPKQDVVKKTNSLIVPDSISFVSDSIYLYEEEVLKAIDAREEALEMSKKSYKMESQSIEDFDFDDVEDVVVEEPIIEYEDVVEVEEIVVEDNEELVVEESYDPIDKSFGTITYNVPDTMKVGNHYKVSLRISREKLKQTLINNINRNTEINSTTTVNNITISDVMEAVLIATEGDFDIDNTLSTKTKNRW